ncbi:MAG: hypothetical protein QM768_21845 [Agriterribacter sp.]
MIDILKNISGDGDLIVKNNDLLIGNSDMQHKQDLLLTEKGSIKQYPDAGVGAQTFLEAEDTAGFLREVSLQFTADGMQVEKLQLTQQGVLNVAAKYSA